MPRPSRPWTAGLASHVEAPAPSSGTNLAELGAHGALDSWVDEVVGRVAIEDRRDAQRCARDEVVGQDQGGAEVERESGFQWGGAITEDEYAGGELATELTLRGAGHAGEGEHATAQR